MIDFISRSSQSFATHELERLLTVHVEIDEQQRQVVLLALAELALRRPGWNEMLTECAKKFTGLKEFQNYKATSASRPNFSIDRQLLEAAAHALRSYQHGNAAPDLAKRLADKIEERLLKE